MSGEVKARIFIMVSNLRVPKMGRYIIALLAQLERNYLMHGDDLHAAVVEEKQK